MDLRQTIYQEIRARLLAQGKTAAQVDAMFVAYKAIDKLGSQISRERREAKGSNLNGAD